MRVFYVFLVWVLGILVSVTFTKHFPPWWYMYLPWLAFAGILLALYLIAKGLVLYQRFTAAGRDSTARRFRSAVGTRRK